MGKFVPKGLFNKIPVLIVAVLIASVKVNLMTGLSGRLVYFKLPLFAPLTVKCKEVSVLTGLVELFFLQESRTVMLKHKQKNGWIKGNVLR